MGKWILHAFFQQISPSWNILQLTCAPHVQYSVSKAVELKRTLLKWRKAVFMWIFCRLTGIALIFCNTLLVQFAAWGSLKDTATQQTFPINSRQHIPCCTQFFRPNYSDIYTFFIVFVRLPCLRHKVHCFLHLRPYGFLLHFEAVVLKPSSLRLSVTRPGACFSDGWMTLSGPHQPTDQKLQKMST